MTKLDEILERLCPDGVEYRKLGEVTISLPKGTLKQNELIEKGQYPVINSGRDFYGYYDKYNNEGNSITIASRGEYAGFIHYSSEKYWAGGLCYPIKSFNENILLTKFLYYCLKNREKWIRSSIVSEGSIPALNKSDIDKVSIPLPPLEAQRGIVRVLDEFTMLTAELTAELTARKKQYEYYREQLLTSMSNVQCAMCNENKITQLVRQLCPNGVEYKKIKEVYKRIKGTPITAGKMKEIENPNGEIRIFAGGKTVINAKEESIPNANITRVPAVLVQSRGVIDAIYYDKPFTFKNEMWAYTTNEKISVKYLYYVLKTNVEYFRSAASGMGSLPQISLPVTEEFIIPVPPMAIQKEIVDILDRFDAYCNDITQGLPAEIEARKKQYEYYRDRLLTFKEKQ